MWTKNANRRGEVRSAENGPILRSFSSRETTGPQSQDCYTFERFAASPAVIRTAYYYHYEKYILGLKEKNQWS